MPDRHEVPASRPRAIPPGASPRASAAPATLAPRFLLDDLARGDHAALSALYEAWFPRALALARTMTRRDESFCLDVVQETFVRVIDNAPRLARLAGHDDLDRWMAAVVRSAAIDLLRREARRTAREAAVSRSGTSAADAAAPDVSRLQDLIEDLHPDDQELLMLRFGRGATLDGAARAIGSTLGSAYGRIRRSLQKLRKTMQKVDHE